MEENKEAECLIDALFELSEVIESEDGIPNAVCRDAAWKMQELLEKIEYLEQMTAMLRN